MLYSYSFKKKKKNSLVTQLKMSVFITSASVFYRDLLGMIRPVDFILIHILKYNEPLSGTLLFCRFRFIYFLAEKVSECNCHIDPLFWKGRMEP